MSACVEGSSQTTRIEIMRIKRGENIALQPHKTVMGVGHRELVLGASSTTASPKAATASGRHWYQCSLRADLAYLGCRYPFVLRGLWWLGWGQSFHRRHSSAPRARFLSGPSPPMLGRARAALGAPIEPSHRAQRLGSHLPF
eukprot:3243253-Prymnesium_polylepis.3